MKSLICRDNYSAIDKKSVTATISTLREICDVKQRYFEGTTSGYGFQL